MGKVQQLGGLAHEVFHEQITRKCRNVPTTSAEMQALILESGATVVLSGDAPPEFTGVQIGSTIYVNGTVAISDFKRLRILAHEWFHFLRRRETDPALLTYLYTDHPHTRDIEEHHAKEFERLF